MRKKGLSNIVGAVLIVLLTLAGVGIAWTFLSPIFNGSGNHIAEQSSLAGVKYNVVSIDSVVQSAIIEKSASSSVSGGFVAVLIDDTGGREIINKYKNTNINVLSRVVLNFSTNTLTGNLTKLEIYATTNNSDGKIIVGDSLAGSRSIGGNIVGNGVPISCTTNADCNDSNVCTINTCNTTSKICETSFPLSMECDDGNSCTGGGISSDYCSNGNCQPGASVINGTSCGNSNMCDGVDTCQAGVCTQTTPPVSCPDPVYCDGVDVCNQANGNCVAPGNPCSPELICNETSKSCDTISCVTNADCIQLPSATESCNLGTCQYSYTYFRTFVTSLTYNGNISGLGGADAACQFLANSQSLGGSWKAWLSSGGVGNSAMDRLHHSTVPYMVVNVFGDGVSPYVANNWTDLTNGTLNRAINIYENGYSAYSDAIPGVYTATNTSGGFIGFDCNGWTSSTAPGDVEVGIINEIGVAWTYSYLDPISWAGNVWGCGNGFNPQHLYCFEQPLL